MRRASLSASLILSLCLAMGTTACTVTVGKDGVSSQEGTVAAAPTSSEDAQGSTEQAPAASDAQDADAADVAQDETASPVNPAAPADPLDGITAESRVVALSRSVAQMWALAGGSLVGVTSDAQDIAFDATLVGTSDKPSVNQVKKLEPQLVLLSSDMEGLDQLQETLTKEKLTTLVVDVHSFDDYADQMFTFTKATGHAELYEQNVRNTQARVEEVIAKAAQEGRGGYLALRVTADGAQLAAEDDFACAMLDDMGLAYAEKAPEAEAAVNVAELAKVDPDWIFVVCQGDTSAAQEAFEADFRSNTAWTKLAAAKAGHVVMLPQDLFGYWPCARWGEAYAYLSQVLHGAWA